MEFSEIFSYLDEYNAQPLSPVPEDIKCNICDKVMVHPSFGPCGCQYCRKCIKQHLGSGDQMCPGSSEHCKDAPIVFKNDIQTDHRASVKISRVKVECPFRPCSYNDHLFNMVAHVKKCSFRSDVCPYSTIGCDHDQLASSDIAGHHSKLLLKYVATELQNIKIITGAYKSENILEELKQANVALEEKMNQSEEKQAELHNSMAELLRRFEETTIALQTEVSSLTKEMQVIKETAFKKECDMEAIKVWQMTEISLLKCEIESLKKDNGELMVSLKESREKLARLKRGYQLSNTFIREKAEVLERSIEDLKVDVANKRESKSKLDLWRLSEARSDENAKTYTNLQQDFELFRTEAVEMIHGNEKLFNEFNELQKSFLDLQYEVSIQKNRQFIWKISNLKQKKKDARRGRNDCIHSNDFYTQEFGHRMCLRVFPNGDGEGRDSHMSIYIVIMRGDYDDVVEWPCRNEFAVGIVDLDDGSDYVIRRIKYETTPEDFRHCFHKPVSETNSGYGSYNFIKWDFLIKNERIYRKDAIYLRCRIFPS